MGKEGHAGACLTYAAGGLCEQVWCRRCAGAPCMELVRGTCLRAVWSWGEGRVRELHAHVLGALKQADRRLGVRGGSWGRAWRGRLQPVRARKGPGHACCLCEGGRQIRGLFAACAGVCVGRLAVQ